MKQLTEDQARDILTCSLINFTQVAVKFYEGREGVDENPANAAKALRSITLRSKRISEKTLERLTQVLCTLYEKMTNDVII